jgi:hypothetical protein
VSEDYIETTMNILHEKCISGNKQHDLTYTSASLRTTSKWLNAISISIECPFSAIEKVAKLSFVASIDIVQRRSPNGAVFVEEVEAPMLEPIDTRGTLPKYGPKQAGDKNRNAISDSNSRD